MVWNFLHTSGQQYGWVSDASIYKKMPVYYVQHRPMFEAEIVHNNKKYYAWFLFDTGRDGSMQIGNDFTAVENNWNELQALTMVNGRKIIRLDARIVGVAFRDIVTNASNPAVTNAKASLFGNQVLKHFNVILDNRTGTLYLKPNSLSNEPYFNPYTFLLKGFFFATLSQSVFALIDSDVALPKWLIDFGALQQLMIFH